MGPIESLARTLAQYPFFREMTDNARVLIAGCAANAVFRDGDAILREGDPADTFYYIRHGSVALEVNAPGRRPLVIETLGDGEVLGWSWLVPPYRLQFDARAVGLVRLLAIDGKCLRDKCEQDFQLDYELHKHFLPVVVGRLAAARIQLIDMYGHPGAYMEPEMELAEMPSAPAKPYPAPEES